MHGATEGEEEEDGARVAAEGLAEKLVSKVCTI
jgi:hypothetical protein